VAIVTGSSTGIGRETALCFARNGYYTIATLRNQNDKIESLRLDVKRESLELEIKRLDVMDSNNIKDFFNNVQKTTKRIDVLVNNAGYGLFGAVEDFSMDQIRRQFDTNFFGAVDVIQNAVRIMRERNGENSKKIINVSSLNGLKAYPLFSAYNSSKFALEGLSETLSGELHNNSNIYSVLVEFGAARTEFPFHLEFGYKTKSPDSFFYKESELRYREIVNKSEKGILPSVIATRILEITSLEKPKERYLIDKKGIAKPIFKKYLFINK
jgi:NAD(P)-dependent dehydrogenase (short-subunit alcohol dehydrogenase family)